MVQYQPKELEQFSKKRLKETCDRLNAVQHISVEHFRKHTKIEGFYEDADMQHLFQCDRLMKVENIYSRLQIGYNPNKGRSFILANLKTSIYDTVASRYQKEMRENQMRALLKGDNQNRAYVSRRWSQASVLLDKRENKPWTEESIKPYYGKINMEALRKTMPFFAKQEEEQRQEKLAQRQMELKKEISENSRKSQHSDNRELHHEALQTMQEENTIQMLILRKEMTAKFFLRKINYAFDIQKHEMFQYYKVQREHKQVEKATQEQSDDEDENR